MAIKAGEDTFYQAKRGVVQDGLAFSVDTSLRETRSATTIRSIGGNRNVSILNGPEFHNSRGGAYQLDGTDDYFNIVENGSVPVANFPISISCWFKTTNSGTLTDMVYMQTSKPASGGTYIMLYRGSSSKFVYEVRGSGGSASVFDSSVNVVDGDWHNCVAVSSSSNNHKVYIDGNLINSNTTDVGSIATHVTSVIGCSYDYAFARNRVLLRSFFNGDISRVSIYNKALTAAEVLQNYNATRHRFGV